MRFTGQPIRNRRLPHANAGSDLASRGVESPDRADALIGANHARYRFRSLRA
jgi:hypothetical protein